MNSTKVDKSYVRRNTKTFLIIFTIIITVHVELSAQVLSLDSLLALIDEKNPMLQEYDSRVQALNEYSKGSRSWMAPMVGAGTFMRPYPGQRAMNENEKGSWMFSVEQQIPNPVKLRANENYQRSRAHVEQQGRGVALNALKSEAKLYYFQWLVSQKKINILNDNVRIVELMIKLARIRYPYNQGSLGNIYKAEGRLSEIQNMILMTKGEIENDAIRLKALSNLPSNTEIEIDTTTVVKFDVLQISNDTAALAGQRSDVRQINQRIELMRLNQILQKKQSKPDFRIRFDHMQPIGAMPVQFTAMGMISIPIAPWSSKMYKSEIRGMEYDIQAMQRERESIVVEAKGMLDGMSKQIGNMKAQLSNYDSKIIPALRKNYQATMIAYEENREQLPMIIDAWEALNIAQIEYTDKLSQYYVMIVNYEKVLEK